MKKSLILLMAIFTIFLANCSKEPNKGAIVDINVKIAYKNDMNNDLLVTDIQNHFSSDSIHVYNVNNRVKVERFYGNLDNPRLWEVYKDKITDTNFLIVGVETDTTLLELNGRTIDTLTCVIEKSIGNTILKKVWYNGVLKWGEIYEVPRVFTIVK